MSFTAEALMAFPAPEARQTLSARDAILYALSTGYGADPCDPAHLAYIWENQLRTAPTLANVTAHPGPWMKEAGVNWDRLVHAEQRLEIHRPIPIDVPLVSRSRMRAIVDRGTGKGMFATFERVIHAVSEEAPLATILQTNACLGDGGIGSLGDAPEPLPAPPAAEPDARMVVTIPIEAAALYRLNGDLNGLHIDPAAAARGGFPRPIVHGLCTFGYAGYAISSLLGDGDLAQLRSIGARFSAPLFPGEELEFQVWRNGGDVRFRAVKCSGGTIVLDRGVAGLA